MVNARRQQHSSLFFAGPEDLLRQARVLVQGLGRPDLARARLNASHVRGQHGRRRAGQGEDFWQFRAYQSGDPADRIDWRRSGRGDQLYIREREWDTAQTLYLWVDPSGSMDFSSAPKRWPAKAMLGRMMGLAAALAFLDGGERVGLLGADMKAFAGAGARRRLADALSANPADNTPTLAQLPRLQPPPGSHLLLISDHLDPPETWQAALRALARPGVHGHGVCLLDPAEEDFPFHGRVQLRGLEGEADALLGRADALRPTYVARLARHMAAIEDSYRGLVWRLTRQRGDKPAQAALLAIIAALAGNDRQGA
ncbi:MAG: DUF58 domain-containing protein [Sphingomonadales bacterium]